MRVELDRSAGAPLYRQLVDTLAGYIRRGILAPGTQLPTIRQMALDAGVTRLTVQNAYSELQALGLVISAVGRGTFVAERAPLPAPAAPAFTPQLPISWRHRGLLDEMFQAPSEQDVISFGPAFPDPSTFPLRAFERAVHDALAEPGSLAYGPPQGDVSLREALSHLLLDRGIQAPPESLLVTHGAQAAINLVVQALTQPDDILLMEAPTFPGALEVAALHRRRVVGLPMDDEGVRLVELEHAMRSLRPRLLYLIPTFHNPTGVTTPDARRRAILDLARRYDTLVVEDDVYSWLAYDAPPPLAMKSADVDGRVIYLSGFSKALIPGIRIGVIAAAPPLLSQLTQVRQGLDLTATTLTQRALALYLRRGHLGAHFQAARAVYRERRDLMLDLLAQSLPPSFQWTRPGGGFSVWLQLPPGISEESLTSELTRQGVLVTRGQLFYPHLAPLDGHIRISFSMHDLPAIRAGMARLTAVCTRQAQRYDALMASAPRDASPFV